MILIYLVMIGFVLLTSCYHNVEEKMPSCISTPSMEGVYAKVQESSWVLDQTINGQWWKIFSDEQLNHFMDRALIANPSLQEAEDRVIQAQAKAKAVRSNLFPSLGASAEENWQYLSRYGVMRDFFPVSPGVTIPSKMNLIDLSLRFSYELDFFGKNRKQLQAALGIALAKQMERSEAELVLCTSVAYAYFSWQSHYEIWRLLQQKLSYRKQNLSLLENRYEQGIDPVMDVLHWKDDVLSVEQKIEDIEKNMRVDAAFLRELLGENPDHTLSIDAHWKMSFTECQVPHMIGLDVIGHRPDVKGQLWRIQAALEEVGVAKAEFYPNVNLTALAGLSSLSFSHLFDWASRTGSLQPAIHLPLFTGGRLQANLDEKVAQYGEMVHAYNGLILHAAQEIVSEVTSLTAVLQQIQKQVEKMQIMEKLQTIAELSYHTGIDPYLHVLLAQDDLLNNQIDAVQLQQYQIMTFLRLVKAIGGGWDNHE